MQVQPAQLRRHSARYDEFRAWAGDDIAIPAAERTSVLRRYLAQLVLFDLRSRAIDTAAAVSFFWKIKFGFETKSDPAFSAFMRGLRNFAALFTTPRPQRNELPISALMHFCVSPPASLTADEHTLICAALVYGLRGIQRGGQVADLECRDIVATTIAAASSAPSASSFLALLLSPPGGFPAGFALRCTVRTSKTNPQGARPNDVVIERGVTAIDPLTILDRYTRLRFGTPLLQWNESIHARSTAKFFTDSSGHAISTKSLRDWVRLVAAHSRLQGYYGSHSLRIAGACWAALGGLSLETIMAMGGWKTQSAIVTYLRTLIAAVGGASQRMGF